MISKKPAGSDPAARPKRGVSPKADREGIDAGIVAECLPSDADPDDVAAVRDIPVGRMEFVRVRMFGPDDPFQAMDSLTGDIAKIGEFTLTVGTRDWSPAFEQALAHPVGDLACAESWPAWDQAISTAVCVPSSTAPSQVSALLNA